jgi:succinyl-CoA synthetase alpha subunit
MAVLVNTSARVICQGLAGSHGNFHSEQAIAYDTGIVCQVTGSRRGFA